MDNSLRRCLCLRSVQSLRQCRRNHERRLINVTVLAGITRPKLQQPYFGAFCPEASSTYDPVEPAKSDGPNEAVGDPGLHAAGREE